MKPTDLIKTLRTRINTPVGSRRPICIAGAPAIGKSDCVRAAALAEGCIVKDVRAALLDPVDIGGFPIINTVAGTMSYARPAILPPLDCPPTVLFLDEIDKAAPLNQSALLGITLDRSVHGHALSDNVTIIAARNRMIDRAHSQKMSTALISRMQSIDLEVDLDHWLKWAIPAGINTMILAFLKWRENTNSSMLHNFRADDLAFPAPRTWHIASDTLAESHSTNVERELLIGTVGQDAATEFLAFARIARTVASPDLILISPTTAPVPTDPAALWTTCAGVARKASDANFPAIAQYAARLPAEFGVFLVTSAVRKDPVIQNTRAFIKWAADNQEVMV